MLLRATITLALLLASTLAYAGDEPIDHPTQTERPRLMVPMPAAIVLIVCKTQQTGELDDTTQWNSKWTGHEGREWATAHAMMVCRRQEVQMYDMAEAEGADPQPFNQERCMRSAMLLGPNWDVQHRASSYRFWRVGCPVPIVRKNPDGTEDIIAWKLPDCGHRETVVCEVDTAI